jgi:hypothetical protein
VRESLIPGDLELGGLPVAGLVDGSEEVLDVRRSQACDARWSFGTEARLQRAKLRISSHRFRS